MTRRGLGFDDLRFYDLLGWCLVSDMDGTLFEEIDCNWALLEHRGRVFLLFIF